MATFMSASDLVSVVMPVYNNEKFVAEAIDSILNQTIDSFEFIIINDHSTDHTPEILASFHDPRILIYENTSNLGLTKSLNTGLALSKGKYIARMDSDDVSHPDRFAHQVHFLEDNPNIGVLGTDYEMITPDGTHTGRIIGHRSNWELVHWLLNFDNQISHPTVFLRTILVKQIKGYNEEFQFAQDYDLWSRLSKITYLANLPETLLYHRSGHVNQISAMYPQSQKENGLKIRQRIISQLTGRIYPLEIIEFLSFPNLNVDPKTKFETCKAIIKIFFSYLGMIKGCKKDNVLSIRKDCSKRIKTITNSMPDSSHKTLILFLNNILIISLR
jgi:glycosyltransferase involved in cell wall biosynthesis